MLPTQREWRHTCLEALKNEWSCVNVVCGIFTDAPGLWPCLRVRHVVEDRTPMFQRGSEFPVHDDKTLILLWLNCKQSVIGLVHILNTRHQGTYLCCIWVYPLLLESRIPRQIILDRRQIFSLKSFQKKILLMRPWFTCDLKIHYVNYAFSILKLSTLWEGRNNCISMCKIFHALQPSNLQQTYNVVAVLRVRVTIASKDSWFHKLVSLLATLRLQMMIGCGKY